MNIQPPNRHKGPSYPSRAGIAALSAVCLWGAVPQTQSAETPATSSPSPEKRNVTPRYPGSAEESLYVRQQAEEEALLAPYADGETPVPETVQQQLQDMVRKYARERVAIWGDRIVTHGEILAPGIRKLGAVALEPGDNLEFISKSFYQNVSQRSRLYEFLGKYAYTDEAMPKEKLEALKDMLLKQIAERQILRAKYAPAGNADKTAKPALPGGTPGVSMPHQIILGKEKK